MRVYEFPSGYDDAPCFLVAINAKILPMVAGALAPLENRRMWLTDQDYEQGYNAIVALEACMTALCLNQLLDSNDRLYRLLDSSLNGTVYTVTGDGTPTDPYIYSPVIPIVPDETAHTYPGMRKHSEDIRNAITNIANGTAEPGYSDTRNIRQQLDDMIAAIQGQGEYDEDMLAKLVQIAALLA